MCSNHLSGIFNKENVLPSTSICKLEKLDTSDFFVPEDSDSDDIGASDLFKIRKRRADSPPLLKPENLAPNQKFYCDLNLIYANGHEYSFEEIRFRKYLNWKKEKAAKRAEKKMAATISHIVERIQQNEQKIQVLQNKIATVLELVCVGKPMSEDKQEVSTMVRELINGSYNETQVEKTVPSIPVKDFTIFKDATIEAPANSVPLIRFDTTECGEVSKHLVSSSPPSPSSSPLSNSKESEKSIDNQTIKEPNCDFFDKLVAERHDPIDMEIEKAELKISQIKSTLEDTKRKSLLGIRNNNKLSMIVENSSESTTATTDKNSPAKMRPPVAACKPIQHDFDLADLSVNPIIHRGSMHFRVSEAFTMYIPNSEDECVPKSCSTPGKT